MSRKILFEKIQKKSSFLCVGLDTDIQKIPAHLQNTDDPVFEFNKCIIDATSDLVVAYKPNTAFYEALGPKGMESLKKTIEYIPDDILVIADAKRADIGNTSRMYAKSFFEYFKADAITVAPYMGSDSVKPFLEYKDKWTIILGLTSNEGSADFQQKRLDDRRFLFQEVMVKSAAYGSNDQIMFVVGATREEYFKQVREILPDHFLLVPGVGAQGGNLSAVCKWGLNKQCGLIVNSSRSIIYASKEKDFAGKARMKALEMQGEMKSILRSKKLII